MIRASFTSLATTKEISGVMGSQLIKHAFNKLTSENTTFDTLAASSMKQGSETNFDHLLVHKISDAGSIVASLLKSKKVKFNVEKHIFGTGGQAQLPNGSSFDWVVLVYFDGNEKGCLSIP